MDEQVLTTSVADHFISFLSLSLISLCTMYYGWKKKFFSTPAYPPPFVTIKVKIVIKFFFAFVTAQAFVVPFLYVLVNKIFGTTIDLTKLDQSSKYGIYFLSILSEFSVMVGLFFTLPVNQRQSVWGKTKPILKNIFFGIKVWFIIYPFVLAFSELISLIVLALYKQNPVDQSVVKVLKEVLSNSKFIPFTLLGVAILVPIAEEILFRGVLQSWLKGKLKSTRWAIILASIAFASVHFSVAQGITNIELLSTLFVLSCFLGFVYERQNSLWASIGLHGFFNGVTTLLLIANEKI